jgi:16S rRNA (guanine527-N7)-methyltransferase
VLSDASREILARVGVDVSRETLLRLECYSALLLRWNCTINLFARAAEPELWVRHIADSAQLALLLPPGITRAIDLGSGAGFPGLVLSLVTGIHFELIEVDRRKAAFLGEAARATAAPVRIHSVRAEQAGIEPALLVTARAFAPLTRLLHAAAPLLRQDGLLLAPKGLNVENELTEAGREWHMRVRRAPSQTAPAATILMLSEIHRAGGPERRAG